MLSDSFTIRPTERGDGPALNRLYRILTGIERTETQWLWEWWDGPFGPAPSWVLVDRDAEAVVGHHGVIPTPLRTPSGDILAARTENSMLDPTYRKRVAYHLFERTLQELLSDRFPTIFTTAGKSAQLLVRKRLGYRSLGPWTGRLGRAGASYKARRLLNRTGAPFAQGDNEDARRAETAAEEIAARLARRKDVTMDPSIESFAATVARDAPVEQVSLAPDAAYLSWRFDRHPYLRRRRMIAPAPDGDAAVAWRAEPRGGGACDVYVELLAASDPDQAERRLQELERLFASAGPCRVVYRTVNACPTPITPPGKSDLDARPAELLIYEREPSDRPWFAQQSLAEGI